MEPLGNLFESIPTDLGHEAVDLILKNNNLKIERIVSRGHATPKLEWYDQSQNEWVLILKGAGVLVFADGEQCKLVSGDHVFIQAHRKHRVEWTDPSTETIWLAVHC